MAGLHAVDGKGRRQQLVFLDQELGGALVGADTGVLQGLRHANEAREIGIAEIVLRFRHRLATEIVDDWGERIHVLQFVVADLTEEPIDIWGVTGGSEVLGAELVEAIAIERVLQMLQGQGVVKGVDGCIECGLCMVPAAAPMILLFQATAARRKATGRAFVPTWVFIVGYLLVWTAIGAITWVLVQVASDAAGYLGAATREVWGPPALGAVLVLAGLYQLTPLKRICLDHCRSPFGFVMQHWREGYGGALRMGVVHGLYCLGCCWALFAVLVAAGVMSLAWMLLLTLVVFAEKVLPGGRRASQVVGVAFLLLGVVVATSVADFPGIV